jgi:hypothetical protein
LGHWGAADQGDGEQEWLDGDPIHEIPSGW